MSDEEEKESLFMDLFDAVDQGNLEQLKQFMTQDKYKAVLEFRVEKELTNSLGEIYKDGETILHIAADKSDAEAVTVLLDAGADINCDDYLGRIPMHLVIDGGCRCVKCSKRNEDCIKVLINRGSKINDEDNEHKTPLHYAAHHMMPSCASILLENGADINHKTDKKPDGFILVQKIPTVMVGELDKGVKFHDKDTSKLQLDFSVILQGNPTDALISTRGTSEEDFEIMNSSRTKEMELLDCMLKAHKEGREMLLTHPLTEAFLFLKWTVVSKWFWIIRILYYTLAILYTTYVFNVYLINCPYPLEGEDDDVGANSSMKATDDSDSFSCEPTAAMLVMSSAMSVGIGFMFLNEFYEIYLDGAGYFRIGLNYAWWILCITATITIMPGFGMDVQDWMYPIAGFGVFFTWGMTLVQVGRIPRVGVYVEMLGKVLKDFAMFFATYFALLLGFALGFCVLFPQNEMFQKESQPLALVKVLLIMIGESDYEGLLLEESNERLDVIEYSILAHVMFVGFIIIITIVLMNLLLGLAVSDIQELQKTASLVTVTRQIQQISLFESLIYSNLLPRRISRWAIHRFSIVTIINTARSYRQEFQVEQSNPVDYGSSNGKSHLNTPMNTTDTKYKENSIVLFEFCPTDPNDKNLPEDIKAKFIPYLTSSPCLNPDRYKPQVKGQLKKVVELATKLKMFGINSSSKHETGNPEPTAPASSPLARITSAFKPANQSRVAVNNQPSTELSPQALQQIKLLLEPLQNAIMDLQNKMGEMNSRPNV